MEEVEYKNPFLGYLNDTIKANWKTQKGKAFNYKLDFEDEYLVFDYLKFNNSIPNSIFILGAGGVASWFIPQLVKSLYAYNCKSDFTTEWVITIVDGDICETKNLLRQNFISCDVGRNKAEVLAERYGSIYPDITIQAIPKYAYSRDFIEHFLPSDISKYSTSYFYDMLYIFNNRCMTVFNLVDNELTKHMLDYYLCRRDKYDRYFSTGCGLHNGNVFTCVLGLDFYSSFFGKNTFIKEDAEIITHSCADAHQEAKLEQSIDSNTVAANLLAVQFNNYLANPFSFNTKKVDFICSKNIKVNTTTSDENVYISLLRLNSDLCIKLSDDWEKFEKILLESDIKI